MATKICSHCGLPKDEEEFNWRFKSLGIRNPACKDCQHRFNKNYYEGDAVCRQRKWDRRGNLLR